MSREVKILIVQNGFLGDIILSTPVIAAVKKIHPEAQLWMMTTPAGRHLVHRDPLLEGVIVFDKRGAQRGLGGLWKMAKELRTHTFDRVYSLHRSARTSLVLALAQIKTRIGVSGARLSFLYHRRVVRPHNVHDVMRRLSIVEPEGGPFEAELRLFAPESHEVSPMVREVLQGDRSYIVLVPGSAWKTKRWFAGGYREVAKHYLSEGYQVVIVGTEEERSICDIVSADLSALNLVGKTSLDETMCILKGARLIVCNDSMALHMASSFKVPTVAIFCATSPSFGFGPWRNNALVVEKEDLPCKPCRRHGGHYCPTGTESCMNDLPPSTVIAATKRVLNNNVQSLH